MGNQSKNIDECVIKIKRLWGVNGDSFDPVRGDGYFRMSIDFDYTKETVEKAEKIVKKIMQNT